MGYQASNVSNNAARRMLSAERLKISELRNKVTELTAQLANVQAENKQLIRQQHKQVTDICLLPAYCACHDDLMSLCCYITVLYPFVYCI